MKQTQKQQGFVALIIATLIVVLVALITFGLTRFMQREQRQALDRQLSAQAFYAAETGINDVYEAFVDDPDNLSLDRKTDCDFNNGLPTGVITGAVEVDSVETVEYTCVLYDKNPEELIFNNISTEQSEVFPMLGLDGAAVQSVTIDWGAVESNAAASLPDNCEAQHNNQAISSVPIIRIDLVPLVDNYNRQALIDGVSHFYLHPTSDSCGVDTIDIDNYRGADNRAGNIFVRCDSLDDPARQCQLTIINMAAAAPNGAGGTANVSEYTTRIKSFYGAATVSITGRTTNNDALAFVGAQLTIDVTGRANDVLQRVKAHYPLAQPNVPEETLLIENGLCKLFGVYERAGELHFNDDCYDRSSE